MSYNIDPLSSNSSSSSLRLIPRNQTRENTYFISYRTKNAAGCDEDLDPVYLDKVCEDFKVIILPHAYRSFC